MNQLLGLNGGFENECQLLPGFWKRLHKGSPVREVHGMNEMTSLNALYQQESDGVVMWAGSVEPQSRGETNNLMCMLNTFHDAER